MMRAHVLLNVGQRHDDAEADFAQALEGFRALGERWGMAFSLSALAELSSWRGDHHRAAALLEEAMGHIRKVGTKEDIPPVLIRYAQALWLRGERDRAEDVMVEAEQVADQVGMPVLASQVAYARAELARHAAEEARNRGEEQRARELFAAAHGWLSAASPVVPARFDFAPQFEALLASGFGYLEAAAGDLEAARAHHAVALERAAFARDGPVLAMIAVRLGDAARAALLLGAAEKIRGAPFHDHPDGIRVRRQAVAALGDSAFAESHQRGHRATLDSVVELASPVLGVDAVARPSA
jgi:ATP/maltotriose-dependent transcriptional regulator MalT